MKLYYEMINNKIFYYVKSTFEEKDIPKKAGFLWDSTLRRWDTTSVEKAMKLIKYSATEEIKETIKSMYEESERKKKEIISLSRASNADIEIPKPEGLDYLPFQKAGIAYALKKKHILIADEMGLGKTIQAIGIINIKKPKSVLIECPAFLKLNWERELKKWLVDSYEIHIVNSQTDKSIFTENSENTIYIINYDILQKFANEIKNKEWDFLIADECHYCKNPKAKRSKITYSINAKKKIFLTGTPILNRPIEIFPVLKYFNISDLSNWYNFVVRYCNGFETKYGWDVSGASNLDELQEKLRMSCMVRRLKKDVLTELPPKIRQIIDLPRELLEGQIRKEKELLQAIKEEIKKMKTLAESLKDKNEEEYKNAVKNLTNVKLSAFSKIAEIRHQTALLKAPFVAEHIANVVESTQKIVVFAHHRDVIEKIDSTLKEHGIKTSVITGETPIEERQKIIDNFQTSPEPQAFIGSTTACGQGITLTASSTVIFAELDWTPANILQAEDRCHRIGQTDSVLVQHVVVDGSIDSILAKKLVKKQEIIEKALNVKTEIENEEEDGVDLLIEEEKEKKETHPIKRMGVG